jgi:hypothetical protein
MRITLTSIAVALGVLVAAPSLAATVTSVKGDVSVNRGSGFQRVEGSVQANAGDFVMAGPGGSGQIVYADGCSIPVNPGSVITIATDSPCGANAQTTNSNDYLFAGAMVVTGGVAVGVALANRNKNNPPASP